MNFCTTRHSSLILCCLDFIFLKAIPALKDKLNNITANGMVILKQSESVSYLQLVSNDVSISSIHVKKNYAKYNMKIKAGKGSSLLKQHQQRFFSLKTTPTKVLL